MRVMKLKTAAKAICALAISCACLMGQTITSTLLGTVQDPAGAIIVGADVQITDQANGSIRTMKTSGGRLCFVSWTSQPEDTLSR